MSASASLGAFGAVRRLVGLRLRRLLNQTQATFQMMRRKPASGQKRTGQAPKAKLGWFLAILVGLCMTFTVAALSYSVLDNLNYALGMTEVATEGADTGQAQASTARVRRVPLPPAEGSTLPAGVLQAVALQALILLLAGLFLSLASGELAKPDWDIEWLVTLPVPLSTLLAVRIAERTIFNNGLLLLLPFLTITAWVGGHGLLRAALLAVLAALPLLVMTATLRTVVDTGLRLSVGPGKLRNLQAIFGVVSILFLYLAMSAGMSPAASGGSYIADWAALVPGWAHWLPPGLATAIVTGTEPSSIAGSSLLLALEAGAFAAVGLAVLSRQLRLGVVGSGARESGRRPATRTARGGPAKRALLTPVQARELVLLSRDRNFLFQSLVMPVVVVGAQYWFNTGLTSTLSSAPGLASIAFFVAAYALIFSSLQTLNTEGNALWILYSVPYSLESVLWQKAILWGIVCLVYPLAVFGLALFTLGPSPEVLGLAVVVVAGVPIFAVIATALGIFASDPLAQIVQRKVRPSYMYLYMLLVGLYSYAIFAGNVWQRLSLMVLTALLGLALWQKARDHLPYLLDPSASPPARVSLSDGLIAALLFFVLQELVALPFLMSGQKLTGRVLLIAFSVAGLTTFLLMRFVYARLKAEGVPRVFGRGWVGALAWGAGGGAAAALAALAYLLLARNTPLFDKARETVVVGAGDGLDPLWIGLMAVVAAPIFEEFIFRGLIYGGLRRTLGLTLSVLASAAIFALVHPPAGVIPVFGLGIAAALVYERKRMLIGPIAVHAVYNAAVFGFQFLPSW